MKLIYEGKLSNRILYLKSVSLLSSVGLAGSYKYVLAKKGFSAALAGVGFAFTPFFLSPVVIAWFFRRYITKLYYDPKTDTFTAHHYGLLLNKKQCTFRKTDVMRSDLTSMLSTFKVGKRAFFLHDEDLIDAQSVDIYRRMVGLDRAKPDEK
uniref:Transmembrane protein 70, mitochondrial n=1 Tax=Aceria tosichella TaxID=561515 RepID=A0A6G1SK27_9ACAR